MDLLEKYYESNQEWSNELVEEIAIKTNLQAKQVSKWLWDQKTKNKVPKKSKKNKRVKTEEYEPKFDKVKTKAVNPSPLKPKTKLNKRQLDIKIDVNYFNDKDSDLRNNQPVQIFNNSDLKSLSKIEKHETSKEEALKNSNFEKEIFSSGMESKHSNKSFGFRERFSKIAKNK